MSKKISFRKRFFSLEWRVALIAIGIYALILVYLPVFFYSGLLAILMFYSFFDAYLVVKKDLKDDFSFGAPKTKVLLYYKASTHLYSTFFFYFIFGGFASINHFLSSSFEYDYYRHLGDISIKEAYRIYTQTKLMEGDSYFYLSLQMMGVSLYFLSVWCGIRAFFESEDSPPPQVWRLFKWSLFGLLLGLFFLLSIWSRAQR